MIVKSISDQALDELNRQNEAGAVIKAVMSTIDGFGDGCIGKPVR